MHILPIAIAFALSSTAQSVKVHRDCTYDAMHKSGGANPACPYQPNMSASGDLPFPIDLGHLSSKGGALEKMKERKGLSPTDFLGCTAPDCPEINIGYQAQA